MTPSLLLAATTTRLPWWWPAVVILAGLAVAAVYAVACLIWPYTSCLKCAGAGRHRSPSGRHWRACRRCKGSGTRLRVGRRITGRISDFYRR